MFSNRNLVIANKHSKEQVIAPLMEKAFELKCIIPEDFDSDRFGSFSGEVERKLDPISAARKK